MKKVVGVIGESSASPENYRLAYEVGSSLARAGIVVVTGGLSGVMEAASRGAREAGGITLGILPGDERSDANPYVDIPVVTGMGYARNSIVVRSSQGIIAIGGRYGTLSEIALALDAGLPVAALSSWNLEAPGKPSVPIYRAKDPEDAVKFILSRI